MYKTTNKINGNIYIGCHKTSNLDDGYLGSGTVIKRAIKKHGRHKFSKEILFVFDNPEQMFDMESVLVNEDFVSNVQTYNLVVGGANPLAYTNERIDEFRSPEQRRKWGKEGRKKANENGANLRGSQKHHRMLKEDPDYRAWYFEQRNNCDNIGFKGKTHTEKSKRKIGKANSIAQKGTGNSNHGKCWICNEELKQNKTIPKEELQKFIELGWTRGRNMKFK